MMPVRDIIDSKASYVLSEVVDSRWYGNPKSKLPQHFVQYLVAWEGLDQRRIPGNCSRC